MKLVLLRPEPGASATAARAAAAGLDAVISPLFEGRPVAWTPPDPAKFDAVFLTSANSVRYAGAGLERYRHLPVHAVGGATAATARDAGFICVRAGSGDAASLLEDVAAGPHRRLLHLCGAHRRSIAAPVMRIREIVVYEMAAVAALLPEAWAALRAGAAALVHSPRAASRLCELVDAAGVDRSGVSLVAISGEAAQAAGIGWRGVKAATEPTDAAMLAIARSLCDKAAS